MFYSKSRRVSRDSSFIIVILVRWWSVLKSNARNKLIKNCRKRTFYVPLLFLWFLEIMLKYSDLSLRLSMAAPKFPLPGIHSTMNSYLPGNLTEDLDSMCTRLTLCSCRQVLHNRLLIMIFK